MFHRADLIDHLNSVYRAHINPKLNEHRRYGGSGTPNTHGHKSSIPSFEAENHELSHLEHGKSEGNSDHGMEHHLFITITEDSFPAHEAESDYNIDSHEHLSNPHPDSDYDSCEHNYPSELHGSPHHQHFLHEQHSAEPSDSSFEEIHEQNKHYRDEYFGDNSDLSHPDRKHWHGHRFHAPGYPEFAFLY